MSKIKSPQNLSSGGQFTGRKKLFIRQSHTFLTYACVSISSSQIATVSLDDAFTEETVAMTVFSKSVKIAKENTNLIRIN